ncbi:MAG: smalltalk protein [Alloprevotella sp.]|nr:smalltalk protein [Bacteroidales bacterium]MDY3943549.1 smalltalk protein [Alloprevotella sp.]
MVNLDAINQSEKRSRLWGFIIQAIIAALTALSGVFTGCSLAQV